MTVATRQSRARESREQARSRIIDAATELVRQRSYSQLGVGAVMESVGLGRTLFYRHFDDLGDLLLRASREAIEELFGAVEAMAEGADLSDPDAVRAALETAAAVYHRHGPLLRALTEAAPGDEQIAAGRADVLRRFDELVARSLPSDQESEASPCPEALEKARALNLMNESYLLDAFGREPRISVQEAARTLSELWLAVTRLPLSAVVEGPH